MITQLQLKEVLVYDPESGIFTWISTRNNFRKAGSIAGSVNKFGYIRITIDEKRYMAHCLAWLYMTGEWPKRDLDHQNLDKADNRWRNLREATRSQNIANTSLNSSNSSGVKGVCWHRRRKLWQAAITCDGRRIHLGYFDVLAEAGSAYELASKELFGEFARSV